MVIVVVGAWLVWLRPTWLGGPMAFVVVSGSSMEPTMHSGDLAVMYRRSTYQEGDVVAYRPGLRDGDQAGVVIHRVVQVERDEGLVTRGDNNDFDDPWQPTDHEVLGSLVSTVPSAGQYLQALKQPVVLAAFFSALTVFLVLLDPPKSDPKSRPAPRRRMVPPLSTATAGTAVGRTDRGRRSWQQGSVGLLGIVALATVASGNFVASASQLVVDGGVIQIFTMAVAPEQPGTEEFAITIQTRFFNSADRERVGQGDTEEHVLAEGHEYSLSWSGDGTVIDCADTNHDKPEDVLQGEGHFTVSGDATHVFCVRGQEGDGAVLVEDLDQ